MNIEDLLVTVEIELVKDVDDKILESFVTAERDMHQVIRALLRYADENRDKIYLPV